jgi:hypothetical protein
VLNSRVASWPYPRTFHELEGLLPGTNTLAYYEHSQIIAINSFIAFGIGLSQVQLYLRFNNGQNKKLAKWQVDKTASWQNGKLTKWQIDKMVSRQNGKLAKLQME